MFLKLLTPVILWVYDTYRSLTWHRDYEIIYRTLEYTIDPDADSQYIISNDFWIKEEEYWSPYNTTHFADITHVDLTKDPIPSNIRKCLIHVKYYYRNKVYKYLATDFEYTWPPREPRDMQFTMPIVRAVLMNDDGQVSRDVTKAIQRFAGPKNNFYGEDILIQDIFSFTKETLEKEYPYLVISDVLNNVKAFKTSGTIRPPS